MCAHLRPLPPAQWLTTGYVENTYTPKTSIREPEKSIREKSDKIISYIKLIGEVRDEASNWHYGNDDNRAYEAKEAAKAATLELREWINKWIDERPKRKNAMLGDNSAAVSGAPGVRGLWPGTSMRL